MKRKTGFGFLVATAAFGALGFFLRRWQLETAFESETGLLTPGRPATAALIALVVVAAAVLTALAVGLFRGGERPRGYLANLAAPNLVIGLLTLLAGALLFAGGALGIRDFALQMDDRIVRLVLGISLAVTGVAVGLIGLLGQQRKEAKGRFAGALLAPGYCACVWLIAAFQGHTANPNIMEYVFLLLGILCAIFAGYAAASFAFETPRPVLCAVASSMGTVLLFIALADRSWGMDRLALCGFLTHLFVQLLCLVWCRMYPPELEEWTPPQEEEDVSQQQVQPRGEEDE